MKILLLGLGRANLHVARYLLDKGIEIFLYEENLNNLSEEAQMLIKSGRIKEYQKIKYDLVVSSPGFPDSKPILQELRKKGLEIIDETEFTYNNLPNPRVIAITGTNGKSTTAALISNILSAAGIRNFLGGNIAPGRPFSSALFEKPFDYYVIELSSFQLMRIKNFHPEIAILTNISVDHLNWHKDLNEYIGAKKRIFMNQNSCDYAVLNYNDERVRSVEKEIKARVVFFGTGCHDGAWLNGILHFKDEEIINDDEIPLLGQHNRFNVLAAIATAKILRIPNEFIRKGITGFAPLPHRLEDLGIIGGIRYINNSMSTNEASAIASFMAVPGNKVVIVGGREKGDRAENYLKILTQWAKAVVILGENAEDIAGYFDRNQFQKYKIAKNMDEAIYFARKFAQPGDVIMLNPGFASFGHFRDFQERGEAFKNGVFKD
ncbi:MAG: UDP-N-acetylmuramoyl-L-alanine--D-glutamate ligase [candidate division WOR-3 bacterium]|nr:UDP-N-acetylmuramoyl-L-alanine--D-glutamate ligase [candidate division WOR-3 bacterium]